MDLFPDWNEICIKVKVYMMAFHATYIGIAYLVFFKARPKPAGTVRKTLFFLSSGLVGLVLFLSMFAYDWAGVLP